MVEKLRESLNRAVALDEILSDCYLTSSGNLSDSSRATMRLESWCQACAGGDWTLFQKRLGRDGLTIEDVLSRFTIAEQNPATTPPLWVSDWKWISEALTSEPTSIDSDACSLGSKGIPFGPVFLRLVIAAKQMMLAEAGALDCVHPSVQRDLCVVLLNRLAELSSPALYEKFSEWRTEYQASTKLSFADPSASDSFLQQYVSFMTKVGFVALFREKPVLMRLIAVTVRQWIKTTAEFLKRFESDRKTLREFIVGSEDGEPLVAVRCGLSDLHNEGHSVLLLTFADGTRVLYKPKDLRPDGVIVEIVSWLNEQMPPQTLRVPRVLVCDHYGWTEFIEFSETSGERAAKQFYEKAGAWLLLFHVLCGTDMHLENMIATGTDPVPIDFEMICQAEEILFEEEDPDRQAHLAAQKEIGGSVLSVGLLPAFTRTAQNDVVDLGGLAGDTQRTSELYWSDVNTIQMRPVRKLAPPILPINVPTWNGMQLRLSHYADSVERGFESYGRFFIEHRHALLATEMLQKLSNTPLRALIRPTRFYAHLLERLKDVRKMSDGVQWSTTADFPSRLADWDLEKDPLWPVVRSERKALLELNIPYFFTVGEDPSLCDMNGPVLLTGKSSGLMRTLERIKVFDDKKLCWQQEMIRMSLTSIPGPTKRSIGAVALDPPLLWVAKDTTTDVLTRCADSCYLTIRERAFLRGSSAAWIGIDWLGDSEAGQLVPLGMDLYNGLPGIAIFLAAYARLKSCSEARTLAIASLASLRSYLHGMNGPRLTRNLGLGGATGIGSILYALCVVGELLSETELIADAVSFSALITPELISADRKLDLIGGSAGAILSLCKLHRCTNQEPILEKATACGHHLLVSRSSQTLGQLDEKRRQQPILTGMAHGAAGIAMSLGVLSKSTDNSSFAEEAGVYISYENSLYSQVESNWPDLRDGVEHSAYPCQWCYGASGIGLARVSLLASNVADPELLTADIKNALHGALQRRNTNDTLCCGDLGTVALLADAGKALSDNALSTAAVAWTANIAAEAEARGDFRWLSGNKRYSLGLFRGLSGVGYSALRGLQLDLPNVLIWE